MTLLPLRKLLFLILHSGTEKLQGHDSKRTICMGINLMSLLIVLLNFIAGPIFFIATKSFPVLLGALLEAFLVGSLIWLNYKSRYNAAGIGFFLVLNAATFYFSSLLGKAVEAQLMPLFLIGLSIFMFDSRAILVFCICLSMALLIVMEINYKISFIKPISATESAMDFMRWTAYVIILTLVILLFFLYKKNTTRLYKILEGNLKKEERDNQLKSAFMAESSHEVKGGFWGAFAIIMTLEKMEKKSHYPNRAKSRRLIIDHLRSSCEYLKSVLNNVLDFSQFESGAQQEIFLEYLDLRLVFTDLVNISKYYAIENNIDVSCQIADNVPDLVLCDRIKLVKIATNLINNAMKFSPVGGHVIVRLFIDYDTSILQMDVQDQGKGIDEGKLDSVFEPYFSEKTLEYNTEGVGLGLYITKKIVHELKGTIKVSSIVGIGTTFSVFIPVSDLENNLDDKIAVDTALTFPVA
jgi:signal transduction histidine kinase